MEPLIKYPGGKGNLSQWFQSLSPPHLHRVHPYAGGLGEFWNWPHENVSEVVNDVHRLLINLFRVVRDPQLFAAFSQQIALTPFSELQWGESQWYCEQISPPPGLQPSVFHAYHYYIKIRQSFAGIGKTFTPITRNRLRRGMNEQVSAWLSAVDGLTEIHARLQRVVLLCQPALEVIESQDGVFTFQYLDPPYLLETRTEGLYEYEMTAPQHAELLDLLQSVKSKIMISGYPSTLYNQKLAHWNRHERVVANSTSTSTKKRAMNEIVWLNY